MIDNVFVCDYSITNTEISGCIIYIILSDTLKIQKKKQEEQNIKFVKTGLKEKK